MAKQMPASNTEAGSMLTPTGKQQIRDALEYFPHVGEVRFSDQRVSIVFKPGAERSDKETLIGFMLTRFDWLSFESFQHRVIYFTSR